MKSIRIKNIMVGILCLAAALILAPAMDVSAETEGTVIASSANIRTSADPGSTVRASVLNGAKLNILDEVTGTDGNVWYKVEIDPDNYGYVRSDLVTKKGEVASNTGSANVVTEGVTEVQPVSASVSRDSVNIRSDASTSSSKVSTIGKEVVFTVTGTKTNGSETWYRITFVNNGAEVSGFVRSDFVTLSGELTAPTTTPAETDPVTNPGDDGEGETPSVVVYELKPVGETWYLIDNINNIKYPIQSTLDEAEKNAKELVQARKKISKQKSTILILIIIILVIIMAGAFLAFKLKEMMDDGAFDTGSNRRPSGGSRSPSQRSGNSRPAGQRTSGANTTRQSTGTGNNNRPATRSMNGTATKPNTQAVKPAGTRPVSATMEDVKASVQSATGFPPTEKQIEEESKKTVEELEKKVKEDSSSKKRQSKNFLEDDEFAFEFLNWEDEK